MEYEIPSINNCRELYAVLNESTGNLIFSAKGSAYKSINAVNDKLARLRGNDPRGNYSIVKYALVDNMPIKKDSLMNFLEG